MKIFKQISLLTIIYAFAFIHNALATSTFASNTTVSISIDSITNNTNAGQLSGLDIIGLFEIADPISAPGFGQIPSGDGNSSFSYSGNSLDSTITTVNAGDSFSQTFSATGNASNGSVDAYYQAFGGLEFTNNTTDSYTIGYTINYDLNALVSGDFATNTVALEYFNDLGDIYGYEESASSTLLNLSNQNLFSNTFSLTLGAFESDIFYADVSINGYVEAITTVPVPSAGWLMLSGLMFLNRYRKSNT